MMTYTIRPICTGYQLLDKGWYATFRRGHGELIDIPYLLFCLKAAGAKYWWTPA